MNSITGFKSLLWDVVLIVSGIVVGLTINYGPFLAGEGGLRGEQGFFGQGTVRVLSTFFAAVFVATFILIRTIILRKSSKSQTITRLSGAILVILLPLAIHRPGATVFLDGFESTITTKANLPQLQSWAQDLLDRHANGDVKLESEPGPAYNGALIRVATTEIPAYVQNLWGEPPDYVAIANFSGDTGPCVLVSWYMHGILIGPKGFMTKFESFDTRQIDSGIYIFILER